MCRRGAGAGPTKLEARGGRRMIDFGTQRRNMVESQVRTSDITDRRILRAMLETPREVFVPAAMRVRAYADADVELVPAGSGHAARALLAPRTFARLVQLAGIEESDAVLDVGTATGYSAAIIARLAATVVALECDEGLADEARNVLSRLSRSNVRLVTGDLSEGCAQESPYDAILVEGAIAQRPAGLLEQLKHDGRLVAILAPADADAGALGKAVIWRRLGATFDETIAFDAAAPVLPGFEKALEFTF